MKLIERGIISLAGGQSMNDTTTDDLTPLGTAILVFFLGTWAIFLLGNAAAVLASRRSDGDAKLKAQ